MMTVSDLLNNSDFEALVFQSDFQRYWFALRRGEELYELWYTYDLDPADEASYWGSEKLSETELYSALREGL